MIIQWVDVTLDTAISGPYFMIVFGLPAVWSGELEIRDATLILELHVMNMAVAIRR